MLSLSQGFEDDLIEFQLINEQLLDAPSGASPADTQERLSQVRECAQRVVRRHLDFFGSTFTYMLQVFAKRNCLLSIGPSGVLDQVPWPCDQTAARRVFDMTVMQSARNDLSLLVCYGVLDAYTHSAGRRSSIRDDCEYQAALLRIAKDCQRYIVEVQELAQQPGWVPNLMSGRQSIKAACSHPTTMGWNHEICTAKSP